MTTKPEAAVSSETSVSSETAMLSGAEMVVQSLIEEGVEQIFGYPGGSVLDIYDALHAKTAEIKHVLVRHEQAATHMADGYTRSTGKPGVVLVCSGPGATNTVNRYCHRLYGLNPNDCYFW